MIGALLKNLFTAPLDFIFWMKWVVAYVCIRIYSAFHKRRFDLYDVRASGDPVKLGYVFPRLEKDLESPCAEAHLEESSDEVLFYGVNSKSEYLLVKISRGSGQVANAWIHLRLANGKSYQLAESEGQWQLGGGINLSCGNLQMHFLAPMRRWRIFFCGVLSETSKESSAEQNAFVKFSLLWKASSDVYDLTLQSNPEGFSDALARAEWSFPYFPPIKKVLDATNFYAQSGVINGTVSIDKGDDYELYLFGERMRNLGKIETNTKCKFTNILGNTPGNGFTFHLEKSSIQSSFSNLNHGFVVQPDTTLKVVKGVELNIQSAKNESDVVVFARFTAGSPYEVRGRVVGDPFMLCCDQRWGGSVEACFIEFTVGGKTGSGFILNGEVTKAPRKPVKLLGSVPQIPKNVPMVVPFSNEVSQFENISGGKGSSLGKLTELSSKEKSFIVPKGIVVTTAAYEEFGTPEILHVIKSLEDVLYGNVNGDTKEVCNMAFKTMVNSQLPDRICQDIVENLQLIFEEGVNKLKFAVRSSATGEDTAEMSSAGQMDTFLGLQGLEEIFLAVKKCWASQFSHTAVEYKKRFGQPLNCPMAVVVQEMVSCDVAGVLFTCDPLSGDPTRISVTANYGLGESVVSGLVEPDTITFKRDIDDNLELDSVLLGTKQQKVVMLESGGTVNEDLTQEESAESCLPKELAERLVKIAIKIEKYYRTPRDIEWGIANNSVYILQSRPVTNAAAETEFEIKHEFDAPMRCECDYYSVANIGEVMPGATSPLGIEIISNFWGRIFKKQALEQGIADSFCSCKYFASGMLPFYNHMMVTVAEMMCRYGFDTPMSKGFMISMFGRVLDDPELVKFARERIQTGEGPKPSMWDNIKYFMGLFLFDWGNDKIRKRLENHHLNFLTQTSAEKTFASLLKSFSDFDDVGLNQMACTESSSNWNMYIFRILCQANGVLDSNVYGDFSRLLATSSNVESANVPQAMQELAIQIQKDIDSDIFKSMTTEEALHWLGSSTVQSGHKFQQFIKRHGHRCLKELDVHSVTWDMNPGLLVDVLKNIVGTSHDHIKMQKTEENDKIISELHVPLNFFSKCMLKFVLPNCRRAVRGREAAKSLTIKSFNCWRQGLRRLANQMVAEGRIPDADLIFFMSIDEIKELLETRSPRIVSKAFSRRKVFPELDGYKFPEIMHGVPTPFNLSDESSFTDERVADLTMKGIPVSQGLAKGFARVALTLEEALHLKKGEILITYSTDIGWSPYFPIISGVVTELGGIISHGAVVSREYGLPCVVGLHGATKLFRTGDYVHLDGKSGILRRLTKQEE